MSTPGHFAFGNDQDGFEPTLTSGQWRRMTENQGHPPTWKPDRYAKAGPTAEGDTFTPRGRKASHLRASAR